MSVKRQVYIVLLYFKLENYFYYFFYMYNIDIAGKMNDSTIGRW